MAGSADNDLFQQSAFSEFFFDNAILVSKLRNSSYHCVMAEGCSCYYAWVDGSSLRVGAGHAV